MTKNCFFAVDGENSHDASSPCKGPWIPAGKMFRGVSHCDRRKKTPGNAWGVKGWGCLDCFFEESVLDCRFLDIGPHGQQVLDSLGFALRQVIAENSQRFRYLVIRCCT